LLKPDGDHAGNEKGEARKKGKTKEEERVMRRRKTILIKQKKGSTNEPDNQEENPRDDEDAQQPDVICRLWGSDVYPIEDEKSNLKKRERERKRVEHTKLATES
jgi:hypothetical protein